jgi:hypothetical protein
MSANIDKFYDIAFGDGWTINEFNENETPTEITPTIRAAYKVILILVDSIVNKRLLMPIDVAYIVYMNIPYDANDNNHVNVDVSVRTLAAKIIQLLGAFDLTYLQEMIYLQRNDIYHTLFLMSDSTDSLPFREVEKALQELTDMDKNLKLKLEDMYNINVESTMTAHILRVSQSSESVFKQYVQ